VYITKVGIVNLSYLTISLVLRYLGYDFQVDTSKSWIRAHIVPTVPRMSPHYLTLVAFLSTKVIHGPFSLQNYFAAGIRGAELP